MTPSLLRQIQSLAADGQSDPALLARFLRQRDESAFAALVERHGPMVLGVSRRILRDSHAAEDVFQATFLVLARKAAVIRRRESIGSWLHGVALRLAHKAKAQAARATRKDERPTSPAPDPLDDLSWREMRQVLDDELRRLPERYRLPLVLCYLEGRTRDEAAAQLGWSEQRVKGQLERGRDRLRHRLVRRGVALSAALSGSLLAERASAAVPPLLTVAVVPAALKYGTGQAACGASAAVVALANEGIRSMTSYIWKIAAALVLLTGFTAVGVRAFPGGDEPVPQPPKAEDAPAPKAPRGPRAEEAPPTKPVTQIKATLIRKQDGKPPMRAFHVKLEMTNAGDKPIWLLLSYYGDTPLQANGKFTSDAADGQPQSFTGKYFDGEKKGGKGKAIEINYVGRDGFRAFHLPPRADVTFDDFAVESWSDIKWIDVLEALELRVNGKTPLQDWLPYPTMSDQQARIPASTDWGNLDWDSKTLKSRTDYPDEKVTTVTAKILTMRQVPIIGQAPTGPASITREWREWRDGPRMKLAGAGAGKLVFSADGKTLLSSAKYPGRVQHWDTTTGQELPLTKQDTSTRYELLGFDRAGEPLGYQILERPPVANTDSALVLVNLRTGGRRNSVEFSEPDPKVRRYRHVALSPDESTLAISEWPDKVLLFDVKTAQRLGSLKGGGDRPVTAMVFSPDGKTLAVAYAANQPTPGHDTYEVTAWDWEHRQQRWNAMMNTASGSLAFSPDGSWLAAGQDAADVPVWNAQTGGIKACPRATPASRRLTYVAFDDKSLAASWQGDPKGDFSTGVVLWDTKGWKEQMILGGDAQGVWALAFSPQGGLSKDAGQLAFASMSKTLYIKRGITLGRRLP